MWMIFYLKKRTLSNIYSVIYDETVSLMLLRCLNLIIYALWMMMTIHGPLIMCQRLYSVFWRGIYGQRILFICKSDSIYHTNKVAEIAEIIE